MSLTRTRVLKGALIGGGLGGAFSAIPNTDIDTGKKLSRRDRITNSLWGAATGAGSGALVGYSYDTLKRTRQIAGLEPPTPSPSKKPKYRKGPKHEAAKRWGVKEKDILKEATISAFADELIKIAMLGAMAGGAAGYALAPNSIKGKLIGTAIGAGTGSVVGSAARGAKRAFYDEPREREHRELYNYVPGGINQYSNF